MKIKSIEWKMKKARNQYHDVAKCIKKAMKCIPFK